MAEPLAKPPAVPEPAAEPEPDAEPEPTATAATAVAEPRSLPVRVFIPGRKTSVQRPCPPWQPAGGGDDDAASRQPTTLLGMLQSLLPGCRFGAAPDGQAWPAAAATAEGRGAGAGSAVYEVVVQGVSPNLGAPLVDLWRLCHHPDQWLYIVLLLPD